MNKEKLLTFLKNVLFAFVFLSIGFTLGKEFSKRSINQEKNKINILNEQKKIKQKDSCLFVYYVHSTFRCKTCLKIEKLTNDCIEKKFSEELKNGKIRFQKINFQENEDFAKKYKIASGTVLLVKVDDGKEVEIKELNDVWSLYSDTNKFEEYICEGIQSCL